jgi:serine/threonine protein kinase/Tfp pilus assembly protein PilF
MKCPKCHFDNPSDSKFCKECGTQIISSKDIPVTETLETPKEELTTGSTFAGRYQIIEELGKGGMGKVYKAQDTDLKEKVAIKLLKPEIAADKKTIERFRNELKFARKIRHKNVCQMYDLNKEKGAHYITMEYVDGKDLKSMISMMGQLSSGKTIFIAKQVCEGLVEAHRLGVVHRDLKPQNIMVDEEGNARIMDFGIARSLKTKGITAAGVMIGTPEYMSPEQVEGKEVDQRSDIYSLGVILYEMVTGRVPFEGDTPFTIGVKHKSETPKDPKELNTQLPEDLNLVILRCLEKDKEKRYQSAGEVRAELMKIEEGIPTTEKVIPKKEPITSKEITVSFSLKKLFIPALVIVAVAVIAVLIWQLVPKKKAIPLAPSGRPSLAVMYFENNTGDENLDHWRKAIAELLITDLSQSKYINVLSRDKLYNILRQINLLESKSYASEDLKEVAVRGGVNHILQGGFVKAGDTFRINYTLQNTSSGELVGSESLEGTGEESIFGMLDDMTKRIKANFELTEEEIASDIDKQIGKISTNSPEAYRYYSEGVRLANQVEYEKAIQLYKRAIAIDPEFAAAYRSMGISYGNLGFGADRRRSLQRAIELSDRISDRERFRNYGDFYTSSEKTYDKAIEAYNDLLQLYPEDMGGNGWLGILYNRLEEWDKAIGRLEICINNKEETYYPYYHIEFSYRAKGMYDKSQEVLEYYLNNFSDHLKIRERLAWNFLNQGKYELALNEIDKAIRLYPDNFDNYLIKGYIYHLSGDLIEAEKEYSRALDTDNKYMHMGPKVGLSLLFLLQGKYKKAKDQIAQAIQIAEELGADTLKLNLQSFSTYVNFNMGNFEEAVDEIENALKASIEAENIPQQRIALIIKGILYLETGLMAEAQSIAAELRNLIQKGINKKAIKFHYFLVGMIEKRKANYAEAIKNLNNAISLLPYQSSTFDWHAFFIEPLASAYFQSGDIENAQAEYERIISLTTGRLRFGDIYAKNFYMLGKIFEKKGWKGKAIEHYEKFLNLWKDADPGIAEVEDARKRLAGLKSQ